jgi:IMP dehydrogenase/GMP reductase
MEKNVLIAVIGVVVIIGGILIYSSMNNTDKVSPTATSTTASTSATGSTSAQIAAQKQRDEDLQKQRDEAAAKMVAFTIDVTKLPAAQQTALKTIGMDEDSIDITNAMVTCAKADLSESRINEIKGGATTTASEGIKLVSCYNVN